jgi:hypothetical protein
MSIGKHLVLLAFSLAVLPTSGYAQEIIFSEDFESGGLNRDVWRVQPGEGGVVDVVDHLQDVPPASRTGQYALALGRSEDNIYSIATNTADLRLDLGGHEEAMLLFYVRDAGDESNRVDVDAVFLSDDGGNRFEKALDLQPQNWADHKYGPISIDLAAAARNLGLELSEEFVVRFQHMGNLDFAGERPTDRDGLFIDDVVVLGTPSYARPPFADGFEAGVLGPAWRIADANHRGQTAPGTQAQWGMVAPVQALAGVPAIARTGDWALALGRPPESDWRYVTVTAADLHLDLAGKEEATLRFFLRDEGDESNRRTQPDALYLSDDGGIRFVEVLDLDPRSRPDGEYSEVVVDLAEAARQHGLSLTDRMVVRFQQAGSADFAGERNTDRDGFFIDDVTVTAPLSPKEEVEAHATSLLQAWRERGTYEKTEDYEMRVNDPARRAAAADSLMRQALAEIAPERIEWQTAQTSYDADAEVFTITVEHLEPFELPVPIGEAEAFDANLESVQYRDAIYGLGYGDGLTVEYVEVTDPASGRTYVYERS